MHFALDSIFLACEYILPMVTDLGFEEMHDYMEGILSLIDLKFLTKKKRFSAIFLRTRNPCMPSFIYTYFQPI